MQITVAAIAVVAMLTVLHPVVQHNQRCELPIATIAASASKLLLVNVDGVLAGVSQIRWQVDQTNLVEDYHVIAANQVAVDVRLANFHPQLIDSSFLHRQRDETLFFLLSCLLTNRLGKILLTESRVVVENVIYTEEGASLFIAFDLLNQAVDAVLDVGEKLPAVADQFVLLFLQMAIVHDHLHEEVVFLQQKTIGHQL